MDVVAAPGDEQAHAIGAAAREQQSEQLAGRLVGPVNVLDDDEHRPAATEGGERAVHRFDEVGAPDVPRTPPARRGTRATRPGYAATNLSTRSRSRASRLANISTKGR